MTDESVSEVSHISAGSVGQEQPFHDGSSAGVIVYNKLCGDKGKNRKAPCYFCDKFVYQMPRHLRMVHGSLHEVAAVCAKSSKADVQLGLQKIACKGSYKYNCSVLRQGSGVLLIARAPKKTRSVAQCTPCPFCLQFFVKAELYRHCAKCKHRPANAPLKGLVGIGQALLQGSYVDGTRMSEEFRKTVVSRMRVDACRRVAVSDELIVKLGSMLLQKLGRKRAIDISARMRELARLLVRIRQHSGSQRETVSELLSGVNFDRVVAGIESVAKSDVSKDGRRIFSKPGFVTEVAGSLLKCARLKQGSALRTADSAAFKEAEDFITLYTAEATDRLLSAAHASYRILCVYCGLVVRVKFVFI